MNLELALHLSLSFLLNPRLKVRMSLLRRSSPMLGNLELMMEPRPAYTWVNVGDALWAWSKDKIHILHWLAKTQSCVFSPA